MKNDYYVCRWDDYGQFWARVSGLCTGHYGKQDAESLAKHWGPGYVVKSALQSVSTN